MLIITMRKYNLGDFVYIVRSTCNSKYCEHISYVNTSPLSPHALPTTTKRKTQSGRVQNCRISVLILSRVCVVPLWSRYQGSKLYEQNNIKTFKCKHIMHVQRMPKLVVAACSIDSFPIATLIMQTLTAHSCL